MASVRFIPKGENDRGPKFEAVVNSGGRDCPIKSKQITAQDVMALHPGKRGAYPRGVDRR
jgi:hypothetical protein